MFPAGLLDIIFQKEKIDRNSGSLRLDAQSLPGTARPEPVRPSLGTGTHRKHDALFIVIKGEAAALSSSVCLHKNLTGKINRQGDCLSGMAFLVLLFLYQHTTQNKNDDLLEGRSGKVA